MHGLVHGLYTWLATKDSMGQTRSEGKHTLAFIPIPPASEPRQPPTRWVKYAYMLSRPPPWSPPELRQLPPHHAGRERGAKALEERLGMKKAQDGDVEKGEDGEPITSS